MCAVSGCCFCFDLSSPHLTSHWSFPFHIPLPPPSLAPLPPSYLSLSLPSPLSLSPLFSQQKEQPETPDNVLAAKLRSSLLVHETEIPDEDAEAEQVVPNLMDLAQYFENADVGLGKEEMFRVFLAIKQLAEQQPLKSVSFWGKIFGTEQDYIIAEAEYREGEEPQPEDEVRHRGTERERERERHRHKYKQTDTNTHNLYARSSSPLSCV